MNGLPLPVYNINNLIKDIINSNASSALYLLVQAFNDCQNPYDFFDPKLDNEQLKLSGLFDRLNLTGHIDEIKKIECIPELTKSQWKRLIDTEIGLDKLVNGYGKNIKQFINATINGYDVDKYINCDKELAKNIGICEKLIIMKRSDEIIKNILKTFKYDAENFCEYNKFEIYMNLYDRGYPAEIIFNKEPSCAELLDALNLIKAGYDIESVKKLMKIIEDETIDDYFSFRRLTNEDYKKYFELLDDDYDIFVVYLHRLPARYINIIQEYSVKLNMDLQKMLDREYRDDDFDVISTAKRANRLDVIEAMFKQDYMADFGHNFIIKILENDIKNGTRRNIINCLYDKGNDVFNDFDPKYEFDYDQKKVLLDLIANYDLNDSDIEILRDSNIQYEKMWFLSKYIKCGYDVSELILHIDEIDIYLPDNDVIAKYLKKDEKDVLVDDITECL